MVADAVRLRPPVPADAPALAALAGELGYPTDRRSSAASPRCTRPTLR